jgi:protease II
VPPSSADYSNIESHEVTVKSNDGTDVPLSIIHKKGLPMDGTAPTWVLGYGAYGLAIRSVLRPDVETLARPRRCLRCRAYPWRRRAR